MAALQFAAQCHAKPVPKRAAVDNKAVIGHRS
jgi:hypothetical protein